MLGTELRSSSRAVHTLNSWALSPGTWTCHFKSLSLRVGCCSAERRWSCLLPLSSFLLPLCFSSYSVHLLTQPSRVCSVISLQVFCYQKLSCNYPLGEPHPYDLEFSSVVLYVSQLIEKTKEPGLHTLVISPALMYVNGIFLRCYHIKKILKPLTYHNLGQWRSFFMMPNNGVVV